MEGNGQTGFWLQGSSSSLTVQGLAMHGFSNAIVGSTGGANASRLYVYGNFIGSTVDGGSVSGVVNGNSGSAVHCGFTECRVGGRLPWQRNLLSATAARACSRSVQRRSKAT